MKLKINKSLFLVSILFLVLIVSLYLFSIFWPKYEERFFELGLLGKNKKAEEYFPGDNSTIAVNQQIIWHLYLHNHMGSIQNVTVRIKLLNSSMILPDDREHEPSPQPYFMELSFSSDVEEVITLPLSWRVSSITLKNGMIVIDRLTVNNRQYEVEVSSFDENRFRIVFELWVYDQQDLSYKFGWDSGNELSSVSLNIWFSLE